jgi:hypothetical protein
MSPSATIGRLSRRVKHVGPATHRNDGRFGPAEYELHVDRVLAAARTPPRSCAADVAK